MTPSEVGQSSLTLLARILADASRDVQETAPIQVAFIYRHAHHIAVLANDVFMLESLDSSTAARILLRPMMESLFKLAAAAKVETYATEKVIAEIEGQVEQIDDWIRVENIDAFTDAITPTAIELYGCAEKLRAEHKIDSRNKWSLHDTAKKAGLPWQCASDYFYFSQHLYGTMSGIIGAEEKAFRGHTLQSATMTTLLAARHAAQALPLGESAPPHLDECVRLIDVLNELVTAGKYNF